MEVKKSPQADLENKKNIFLEIGLMLALGTILFAFEWKVSGRQPADFVTVSEIPTEIEMVPITMMHQITPPPPPAPKPFDLLEIVDEIDPLSDDLDIIDADDESNNKESFDLNNLNYDEEYDTDEIQCGVNEDVVLCYEAEFNYKTLGNIYWGEPFYSFARNEIKRELLGHGYGILIVATFPKDMPQEKARKIMKDRVAKWKAEREGL